MSPIPPAPENAKSDSVGPRSGRRALVARLVLAVYWPLLFAGTHWPNIDIPDMPSHPLELVLQFDKTAHVISFGGLMVLLLLANLTGKRLAWPLKCFLAMVICLVYALIDELTQSQVAGRSVASADMIANAVGIIGVYLIARQPRRSPPRRIPGWVLWPLILALPFAAAGLLSPSIMSQAIDIKRELWRAYDLDTGRMRMDYWAHGVFSFVAAAITFAIWPARSHRPRRATLISLLVLLLSGPLVEVAQYFTGRGVQALDVLAHSIGVLAAMVLWVLVPARKEQQAASLEQSASAPVAGDQSAFVGHALLVSLLTLLSRFAGLARDAILAAALGLSVAADAFFIGFLVPNLFRRLFGEGALTAAFIPNYTDLLQRDPALAKRFASFTLTLLTVLLIGITIVGELVLWWIAQSIEPGGKASLAIFYTRIMLPYMPLICAVALIGGILQVHKRFGPPAAVPLVLNGVLVFAVLITTDFFTINIPASRVATAVAVAVLVAGALQLFWQLSVLLHVTGMTRSFADTWPTMRKMLLMMGPMVLGLAVFQINALLDALIAFFFAPPAPGTETANTPVSGQITMFGQTFVAPLRNGDVAALNWSQRLYQFPLGVFGIAIATAIFPALSSAAAKFVTNDKNKGAEPQAVSDEFARIVRQGLRLTVFIALPASAGLILVRVPLARTVFEHGSFTTDDALRVSAILAGYASSVCAYSMTHTLTRAFYALKDATTPLKVSACMVLLNLTLNLSLIWSLGAAGLAWSTAISAAGQVVLLILLLRKRVPRPIDNTVIASWTRTMIATTIMSGVLFAASFAVSEVVHPTGLNWSESAITLVVMVLLGAAVFFLIARLMKAEELRWLHQRKV